MSGHSRGLGQRYTTNYKIFGRINAHTFISETRGIKYLPLLRFWKVKVIILYGQVDFKQNLFYTIGCTTILLKTVKQLTHSREVVLCRTIENLFVFNIEPEDLKLMAHHVKVSLLGTTS